MAVTAFVLIRHTVMRHKHFTFGIALAWTMAASMVGCAARNAEKSTTQPASTDIPFVYSSYDAPERLSDAQRQEIVALMAEAKPKAGEPWFVYVHGSIEGKYRVSAYYKPIAGREGIRRGYALFVQNVVPLDELRQINRQLGGEWPEPHSYVQLATLPLNQTPIPAESDLPFSPPNGIGEEELVKIIATARIAAEKADSTTVSMPIREVKAGPNGSVHILFGWQSGGLSGRGRFVELKRDGDGFTATSVGMWAS